MDDATIQEMFAPNRGIVGLPPMEESGDWEWPFGGYDHTLSEQRTYLGDGHYRPRSHVFATSGHTKAEWIALADAMILRWTAWRDHTAQMPEDPA